MKIPGYKIERIIGEGGMATVYLAVQESLHRHVALKLLKKFDTPEQAVRFLNEGRIIASLNHRNIITIHDIGVIGEQHYIAMEYLEGGDLRSRIARGMSPSEALELLRNIGNCLDFVHSKGIVHRDIKPANILFHKDGTPILTDFGIAKQLEQDIGLTVDGTAMGSPYYLSPEQAECKPLDGRTDLYSLGIVFFEMLTTRRPYQGNSYIEIVVAHLSEPVPDLPAHLDKYQDLLNRFIAKAPEDRFSSAAEMVEYIQQMQISTPQERTSRKGEDLGSVKKPVIEEACDDKTLQLDQTLADSQKHQAFENTQPKVFKPLERTKNIAGFKNYYRQIFGGTVLLFIGAITILFVSLNDTDAKIERYLSKAEMTYEAGNLTGPGEDHAYFYYQEALRLSPDNGQALGGVEKIVNHFAEQSENELHQLNYELANDYVLEGLQIQPESRRLRSIKDKIDINLAIREKTHKVGAFTRKVFNNIKSAFTHSRTEEVSPDETPSSQIQNTPAQH